jgi:hypothetical protein
MLEPKMTEVKGLRNRLEKYASSTKFAKSLTQNVTIVNNNRDFLNLYSPYIYSEWRLYYIRYDALKEKYKSMKGLKGKSLLLDFDVFFCDEIQRVDQFLSDKIDDISQSVTLLEEFSANKQNNTNDVDMKIMERTLRTAFNYCKECEEFYKFNSYAIVKIAKKFEKLSDTSDFTTWPQYSSNHYYLQYYSTRLETVHLLRGRCIQAFSHLFRETFPQLAIGELEYAKNHSGENYFTRISLGFKLGIILCLVCVSFTLLNSERCDPRSHLFTFGCCGCCIQYFTINILCICRCCGLFGLRLLSETVC